MVVGLLFTGGLDSALLADHYVRRGARVLPVYVSDGLRWEDAELAAARKVLRSLKGKVGPLAVVPLDQRPLYMGSHWSLKGRAPGRAARWDSIPLKGRNLLLLSCAAAYCLGRADRLAIGVSRHNPFADAKRPFFKAFEKALAAGYGTRVRVEAPFLSANKSALLRAARHVRLDWTFSCIQPAGRAHCGRCTKCAERGAAFSAAGVPDPTRYAL